VSVSITPEAVDVIRRSLELAGADPAQMGVRLRMAGGQIRPRFVAEPDAGDIVVEEAGVRVFVAATLVDGDVEIAVTPEHETLVIRPVGSQE
jgi:hypothetical protein